MPLENDATLERIRKEGESIDRYTVTARRTFSSRRNPNQTNHFPTLCPARPPFSANPRAILESGEAVPPDRRASACIGG
jgi:hypothetical protein